MLLLRINTLARFASGSRGRRSHRSAGGLARLAGGPPRAAGGRWSDVGEFAHCVRGEPLSPPEFSLILVVSRSFSLILALSPSAGM